MKPTMSAKRITASLKSWAMSSDCASPNLISVTPRRPTRCVIRSATSPGNRRACREATSRQSPATAGLLPRRATGGSAHQQARVQVKHRLPLVLLGLREEGCQKQQEHRVGYRHDEAPEEQHVGADHVRRDGEQGVDAFVELEGQAPSGPGDVSPPGGAATVRRASPQSHGRRERERRLPRARRCRAVCRESATRATPCEEKDSQRNRDDITG